ncbi:MAG: flagellar hook assembly protein FlgD [Desulfotomaculales bacterium]
MMAVSAAPVSSAGGYLLPEQGVQEPRRDLDKNAFLQLLVAQLRYQDPLQAQDAQSFINQMVQFTTLEQIGNMQTLLTQLALFSELSQGTALIGRRVSLAGPDGGTVEGVVEKVTVSDNSVYLSVGGSSYGLAQLREVF